MNKDFEEQQNMTIEQLQSEFDKVDESDDIGTIEFVEKHFDFLINFDSTDIEKVEDVAEIFSIYYSCLGICYHWADIIENRDRIINFVNKLKDKREDYNQLYCDIEYVYSQALIEQGNDFKKAIEVLKKINELKPKDEDIIMSLRQIKYSRRTKVYKVLRTITLIIIFSSFVLRLLIDMKYNLMFIVLPWIILVGIYLIQNVDKVKSKRL